MTANLKENIILIEEVKKNTSDIQALTNNMTRLTTLVESAEKRHESDMSVVKEAVKSISVLNDRMSGALGMEKDIAIVRELLLELKGDVRTGRHDLNGALTALQAIPILRDKISHLDACCAAHDAKIDALEAWRNTMTGAGNALGALGKSAWAVFGAGILALGYFVLQLFFREHNG